MKEGLDCGFSFLAYMLENAHFKAQNSPNCIWRWGSARTRWRSLQRSPRPPSSASCM